MDYPFFIRELCSVDPASIEALAVYATQAPQQRHPGFVQAVQTIVEFDRPVLAAVLRQIRPHMGKTAVRQAEILVLPAGGVIRSHSDLAASGASPWQSAHTHKIMVPVTTNDRCVSRHRRSVRVPWTTTVMNIGCAYLYNDYVWHSGHNEGPTDRFLLALSYEDPDLRLAQQLTANLVEG